ncbi:MAG: hypothetical protein S4CHLAM102_06790 [Chlamydiia bacterium]|nr:hypothetical protein [Chlamydiia bacterium]
MIAFHRWKALTHDVSTDTNYRQTEAIEEWAKLGGGLKTYRFITHGLDGHSQNPNRRDVLLCKLIGATARLGNICLAQRFFRGFTSETQSHFLTRAQTFLALGMAANNLHKQAATEVGKLPHPNARDYARKKIVLLYLQQGRLTQAKKTIRAIQSTHTQELLRSDLAEHKAWTFPLVKILPELEQITNPEILATTLRSITQIFVKRQMCSEAQQTLAAYLALNPFGNVNRSSTQLDVVILLAESGVYPQATAIAHQISLTQFKEAALQVCKAHHPPLVATPS